MDLATRGGQGSTPSLEAEDGEGQEEDLEEQGVGVMVEEEAVTGEEMGDMGEALDVVVAMEEVKEVLGVVVVDMDVAVVDMDVGEVVLVPVLAVGEDEEELGHSERPNGVSVSLSFC